MLYAFPATGIVTLPDARGAGLNSESGSCPRMEEAVTPPGEVELALEYVTMYTASPGLSSLVKKVMLQAKELFLLQRECGR